MRIRSYEGQREICDLFYCLVLGWVDLWSGCAQIYYIYIYKIRFSNVEGGGWTTSTATHVWEWLCVFSSEILSFFNLLFHSGWGRGGGVWITCTTTHVWEWLCVFLSEILSSLLWRRLKIKPHKFLLFIICVIVPHFFYLDFLSYCFFFLCEILLQFPIHIYNQSSENTILTILYRSSFFFPFFLILNTDFFSFSFFEKQ